MSSVRVKICGLTSVDDALAACDAGADAIGLVFYAQSSRYVELQQAAVIAAAIPPFVKTVGLFVNPQAKLVEQCMAAVNLDLLQFHGQETEAFCRSFARPYLKAFAMRDDLDLPQQMQLFESASGFLLDAYHPQKPGGTGQQFDWQRFPRHAPKPLILAGGLTADNISAAIKQCQPYAVDVSGGVESAPGKKSAGKMQTFIQRVKSTR